MPAQTLPGLGLKNGWSVREDGWGQDMNANLAKLDALVQGSIKEIVGALPGSPADGDAYILTTDDNVYVRQAGAWVNYGKKLGWLFLNQDDSRLYAWDGADWVDIIDVTALTGALSADDGDESLPGISFTSDPDTGVFRQGENSIGVSAGGAEILRIAAIAKFMGTGAVGVPAGTTAERPASPDVGYARFNTTTGTLETYNGSGWVSGQGGPSLGLNSVIRTNAQTISEDITFLGTENGMSAGPITIAPGFTVTVTAGSTWTVI